MGLEVTEGMDEVSHGVLRANRDHLPVRLALIDHGQNAKRLDLDDCAAYHTSCVSSVQLRTR